MVADRGRTIRMPGDVFPRTLETWISIKLNEGPQGLRAINRHVMAVYAEPLRVYFLGCSERSLGEPDEVINGFFASRLDDPEFLVKWQRSGKRLRRWLINALHFYLKELRRQKIRASAPAGEAEEPVTFDGDPHAAVDRQFMIALVRQALRETHDRCLEENLGQHWQVFVDHHCRGMPYAEAAGGVDVDPARAEVMGRTVARRFRAVVRELLVSDGATPEEVDREIQSLLEASGS
jgi:DNA-directed RNA polymerase specialized sigma24 family protein